MSSIDAGSRLPEEPPPAPVDVVLPDISGLVRAVRRRADLSQRELAERTGLARSTIGRIESRTLTPGLETLTTILAVAGVRLVAVDENNRRVPPMEDPPGDDLRDGAGRRYPSHLDTILDPAPGDWWGDRFGLARPPETFKRDRVMRDVMRRRSVWEVRVNQFWTAHPPPTVEFWIQRQCRCERCGCLPPPAPPPFPAERVERYLQAAALLATAQMSAADVARRTDVPAPRPSPER
ncbi:helix-turn-helix transcriptional regulator [Pseudonocardia sp. C8]|uniref:helix-turn-helix transcriptional regulator n=1 Tax=Pseudonocardia sp. C8 TaxID=2762759 RepID=UPI0016430AD7|nr:helix-turn-helix transcriptional regulator [Pseudonocardia sp. C8]MBC3190183.1 helix-turn-helix transcriptional regulator [Pseudonocardia sp. C8]